MSTQPFTPQQHRAQATANRQLAQQIAPISTPWAWVVVFYAALHYVSEFASFEGQAFGKHGPLNAWLQSSAIRAVWPIYAKLSDRSWIARYQCPGAKSYVCDPSHFQRDAIYWLDHIQKTVEAEESVSHYHL